MTALSEVIARPGPWTTLFFDASTGTVDRLHAADVRPDNVRAELLEKGASRQIADAAAAAADVVEGATGPVSRFLLLCGEEVVVDEVLPGPPAVPELVAHGRVPDLVPLLRQRPAQFEIVVAEVGRDGGEVRLQRASRDGSVEEHAIAGETEDISKVPSGGWSQARWQRHTEEVWRRNTEEVAERINRLVEDRPVHLVVLAGDMRARTMLTDQLSERARGLLSVVESNTRGSGDGDSLEREVERHVAELVAHRQQELLDRLESQIGRTDGTATFGTRATVKALQRAQVETLLISGAEDDGQGTTLLALGDEPWVALHESDALGVEVLAEVPAVVAAVRAAELTGAHTVWVPAGALPDGVRGSALLRWPMDRAAVES